MEEDDWAALSEVSILVVVDVGLRPNAKRGKYLKFMSQSLL